MKRQSRLFKKGVFMKMLLVAFLSSLIFVFCLNSYAEQEADTYTGETDTGSGDSTLRQDPYADTQTIKQGIVSSGYNPFSLKYDWGNLPSQKREANIQNRVPDLSRSERLPQGQRLFPGRFTPKRAIPQDDEKEESMPEDEKEARELVNRFIMQLIRAFKSMRIF